MKLKSSHSLGLGHLKADLVSLGHVWTVSSASDSVYCLVLGLKLDALP